MTLDPTTLHTLTGEVLAVAVDALNAVWPDGYRHEEATVVNGPPSWDQWEGCASMVHAWVETVLPGGLPASAATGPGVLGLSLAVCAPPFPMAAIAVQTYRCEPTFGPGPSMPAADELDAAARLVLVDAHVVWNALACWSLKRGENDEDDWDDDPDPDTPSLEGVSVYMGAAGPSGPPQSGLSAWTTRVIVALDGSRACCPPEFGAFPEGWLPPPP